MQVQLASTKLRSNLSQIATALDTENNADICAAIGAGDFAIVKVVSGSVTEDIKIGACAAGISFIIERGANNTEARFFPAGACVQSVVGEVEKSCPTVASQTWALASGKTSEPFSASHNTGFPKACLSDYSAPEGFEVDFVGGILTINATCPMAIAGGTVVAELVQDGCTVAVVTGSITVIFECPPDRDCE
jgi:hypothetical protein